MRPIASLVHSRTRVEQRYALMPLEGFPFSHLSSWPTAQVRVLASPGLGAAFVQYLIDLPAGETGGFGADFVSESFFYVLSGEGTLHYDHGGENRESPLRAESFGLLPPSSGYRFSATSLLTLVLLKKNYDGRLADQVDQSPPHLGNASAVKKEIWAGDEGALLQTLIPDDPAYDMAINIFTFDPGHGLPIVETHVMEHGLFFFEGKGLYHLGGEWMEVEKDDFIWMGPYCPQSFYATGPTPARYLYYKNVNREIPL